MRAQLLFLGTGASAGVPMIGCHCSVCSSTDSYNKRLRPSALLSYGQRRLLIDVGPDFRTQALRYQISQLDGLLLTHSHFDHVAGLDELRVYYVLHQSRLPVLLSEATFHELKRRYDYLFIKKSQESSLAAQLDFHMLPSLRGTLPFLDLPIHYMQYEQAGMPVTGYRIGSLAYISDIRTYPETLYADLQGVKILILSALRQAPSHMHFNLTEAVGFAEAVGAEKTYFTHMAHELDYHETNQKLPKTMQLAYDGLSLEFEYA